MIVSFSLGLLAMAPPATQPGQPAPNPILNFLPLIFLVVLFYFMILRPQQKRAREHENLLKNLKAGDKVVTNSGIVAVVVSLKDKTVSIRSADTKLEVLKSSIAEVTERGSESASQS
jgi:preprotein translocase subunit YajC